MTRVMNDCFYSTNTLYVIVLSFFTGTGISVVTIQSYNFMNLKQVHILILQDSSYLVLKL